MPDFDLKKDITCKSCGLKRDEADILNIHLGDREVWSGCVVCARVALELPRHLAGLIANAFVEAEKHRTPTRCPAEFFSIVEREVSQGLLRIQQVAREATRWSK